MNSLRTLASNRIFHLILMLLVTVVLFGALWSRRRGSNEKPVNVVQYASGVTNRPVLPLSGTNPPASSVGETVPPFPPLTFSGVPPSPPTNVSVVSNYLPMGKLIPCLTVFAIDSSQEGAPIIAMVSEDVGHQGNVIVPKGSYLHGWAKRGRMRDRILSQQAWVIVFPTGEELQITGVALEADKRTGTSWGPLDGSLGIRGTLIRSDHWAETKLFVAAFLSGAADALKSRERSLFGTEVTPQLSNSALNGTGSVLELYSREVLDRMEAEQFVVRVSAPKSIYVYCLAMVDRNRASVGSSRLVVSVDGEDLSTPKKSVRP